MSPGEYLQPARHLLLHHHLLWRLSSLEKQVPFSSSLKVCPLPFVAVENFCAISNRSTPTRSSQSTHRQGTKALAKGRAICTASFLLTYIPQILHFPRSTRPINRSKWQRSSVWQPVLLDSSVSLKAWWSLLPNLSAVQDSTRKS